MSKSQVILPISLLFLLLIFDLSISANPVSCNVAIASAEEELRKVKSVSVIRSFTDSHQYQTHPDMRYQSHTFWIEGAGAANIMYSPIFMKRLSKEIISDCQSVGVVEFGVCQTDWGASFGIMKDGRIKGFECVVPSIASPPIVWGERYCA